MRFKSIIQKEQTEKLRGLLFSKSEAITIDKIEALSTQYSRSISLNFALVAIRTTVFFLIYSFADKLESISSGYLYTLLISVFVLQSYSLYIDVFKKGYYRNTYTRVTKGLLDNIISLVITDYRVSLAKVISTYPSPKNIANSIGNGVTALGFQAESFAKFLGIVIGTIIITVTYFITGDSFFLIIAIIAITSLVLLLPYIYLGIKFAPKQQKFVEYVDNFDTEFNATQPLLFRSGIELYNSDFEKHLNTVVSTTTLINFISNTVSLLSPILILIFSATMSDSNPLFAFILITTYILSNVFLTGPTVSYYFTVKTAAERIKQLDDLLDTVYEEASELTPKKYQQIRDEFFRTEKHAEVTESFKNDDYLLSNITYISGREESTKEISIENAVLKKGKVNFLIGSSGIGKSLFGRLITLRYSSFKGDFIGLGSQDIRTFKTLDTGLSELHFSGLRSIRTSYRQAIGSYLRPVYTETSFREGLNMSYISIEEVRKHFMNNADYYLSDMTIIERTIEEYTEDPSRFTHSFNELTELEKNTVTDCFRSKLESEIPNHLYFWAIMAEYYTFSHLKDYIPEASMYFMDAILSEPPVSQGQRRRILFALDILIIGKVFVVDEPFSNLDNGVAKRILQSLADYATGNNAVVVALDQEINRNVLSGIESNTLGKFLEFSATEKGYEIIEI